MHINVKVIHLVSPLKSVPVVLSYICTYITHLVSMATHMSACDCSAFTLMTQTVESSLLFGSSVDFFQFMKSTKKMERSHRHNPNVYNCIIFPPWSRPNKLNYIMNSVVLCLRPNYYLGFYFMTAIICDTDYSLVLDHTHINHLHTPALWHSDDDKIERL